MRGRGLADAEAEPNLQTLSPVAKRSWRDDDRQRELMMKRRGAGVAPAVRCTLGVLVRSRTLSWFLEIRMPLVETSIKPQRMIYRSTSRKNKIILN